MPVRSDKFEEALSLIEAVRQRACQAINAELVGLYCQLGEYISRKIESAQWGDDAHSARELRKFVGFV